MAIELKDAVRAIKSGDWVHLRYITADVTKGTGGTVMELPKCRWTRKQPDQNKNSKANRSSGTLAQNHSLHFTINVELPNRLIRKIHPILITHLNKQPVL